MYTWSMRVARDSRRFLGLSALVCLIGIAPAHADSNGILRGAFTFQQGFPAIDISVTLLSPDRVGQPKTEKTGKVGFPALPFQIYEREALSVTFADVIGCREEPRTGCQNQAASCACNGGKFIESRREKRTMHKRMMRI
jgi:hypothetical protein